MIGLPPPFLSHNFLPDSHDTIPLPLHTSSQPDTVRKKKTFRPWPMATYLPPFLPSYPAFLHLLLNPFIYKGPGLIEPTFDPKSRRRLSVTRRKVGKDVWPGRMGRWDWEGLVFFKWSPVLQYFPHTAFCDAPPPFWQKRGVEQPKRLTFLSRESKSYGVFWFRWAISAIDQYTETQTSPNTLSTILGGQMTVLVQDTDLPPSTNRDRPHQYLYNQPRHRQRFLYVPTSSSTAEIEGGGSWPEVAPGRVLLGWGLRAGQGGAICNARLPKPYIGQ